jgi:glycosyltransferase involved in cell wall biosynthesis
MSGRAVTRVMVLAPWARRLGGAETMLATLIAGADTARFSFHVVFLEPGPWAEELAEQRFAVSTLARTRLRDVRSSARTVRDLASLLGRHSPDLLLNWSAKCQLYGASSVALSRRPIPVVWWQHMIPSGGWLDRVATALPAAAIGCSSVDSALAQRRLRPARRAFVVHPGVEVGGTQLAENARRRERGRWVVGLVGNLQPWKGQDRLLRAQALLRARGHDVSVLLVGGDLYASANGYADRLRELIRAHKLGDAVVFTGHVPDVARYLNDMDLFVSAASGEPFGIALLEAMARGLPVVAVADGGPAEIVVSEKSGLLVDSPTPAAIAAALERLIRDPELRTRVGYGARARVTASFSAERMCREIERHLELAAGR